MKIIVTDGYVENPGDLSWAPLEALGEVTYYDRIGLTDEDETIRRIGDAEIAVINKAPVTRKVIDSCPNLKLITVLATGYNVVDVAYAKEKGIPVCNVPNYGGYSVSQFTIALMLEACLHIGHHDRTVHEGKWQNSPRLVLLGLPPHRTGGQDLRSAGLRPHRHPHRRGRQGTGDARHRLQPLPVAGR